MARIREEIRRFTRGAMSPTGLLEAFGRAGGDGPPDLGESLEELVRRARAAWPDLEVDPYEFVRFVADRVSPDGDARAELAAIDAGGLYLACAWVGRNPMAAASFEAVLRPELSRVLSRIGFEASLNDEVVAEVREQLFYGGPRGTTPLLATYRGRGTLRSFLRSVCVHLALKTLQKARPFVSIDALARDLPETTTDPELAYLRGFYLEEFHAALARAIRGMPLRARNLLRQHYIDKLSLEAVAKVHKVHRATAARWLADARDDVLAKTKAELAAAIHLEPSELESVLSFVQKQSAFGAHVTEVGRALRERS